jgi:hypothetical protein
MIPFGVGMSQFVAETHVCAECHAEFRCCGRNAVRCSACRVGRNKALKAAGNKKRRALQKSRKQQQEAKWTATA